MNAAVNDGGGGGIGEGVGCESEGVVGPTPVPVFDTEASGWSLWWNRHGCISTYDNDTTLRFPQ